MRKLNYDEAFSDEDIAWIRQAGSLMTDEQIARHQEQFGASVPEVEDTDDSLTRSALDPNAGADSIVESGGSSAPRKVDPTETEIDLPEEEGDDYDRWTVKELEDEVIARNKLADGSDGEVSAVSVTGTGKNGAVKKEDMIKGLRLWDQENPRVL